MRHSPESFPDDGALVRQSFRDDGALVRQSVSGGAFTLIELLTVMAIIAVLAGLTVGLFGYANRRSVESRTRAEIKALELAIEAYKLDNGLYPQATNTPRGDAAKATLNSQILFRALSGNAAGTSLTPDPTNRPYFTAFNEAKTGNVAKNNNVYYILDANRSPYNYFSTTSATLNATTQTNKFTFDLWSFGIDGANDTDDDIANWKF